MWKVMPTGSCFTCNGMIKDSIELSIATRAA